MDSGETLLLRQNLAETKRELARLQYLQTQSEGETRKISLWFGLAFALITAFVVLGLAAFMEAGKDRRAAADRAVPTIVVVCQPPPKDSAEWVCSMRQQLRQPGELEVR